MRYGIDVSSIQHGGEKDDPAAQPIDYAAVKAAGKTWAGIKLTEGLTYLNSWAGSDLQGFSGAGFEVVAYHFGRPDLGHDARAEAQWFKAHAPPLNRWCLDIERSVPDGSWPGLVQWVNDFLDEAPTVDLLYSNRYYAYGLGNAGFQPGDRKWWMAIPGLPDSIPPTVEILQYGQGPVDGIPGTVDLDSLRDGDDMATPEEVEAGLHASYYAGDPGVTSHTLNGMASDITGTISARLDSVMAKLAEIEAKIGSGGGTGPAPGTHISGQFSGPFEGTIT